MRHPSHGITSTTRSSPNMTNDSSHYFTNSDSTSNNQGQVGCNENLNFIVNSHLNRNSCVPNKNGPFKTENRLGGIGTSFDGGRGGTNKSFLNAPLIITHIVDEFSPLYKYVKVDSLRSNNKFFDPISFEEDQDFFEIVLMVEGTVSCTKMPIRAKSSYTKDDFKIGYHHVGITSRHSKEALYKIDLDHYHDVVQQADTLTTKVI